MKYQVVLYISKINRIQYWSSLSMWFKFWVKHWMCWAIPEEKKQTEELRVYFFETPPGIFHFFTLLLEITDKTKLHPWKFHKNMLRPFSFRLNNASRWEILPRFFWVHAQFKHHCAISENRAKKLGGKKFEHFQLSSFLVDFLSWNFNS